MTHYKVTLAYDGTNFAGYQVQPKQRTVQGVLQKALTKMTKGSQCMSMVQAELILVFTL